MTVHKPMTVSPLRSAMNQLEFLAITFNLLKAREKSYVQVPIGCVWLLIGLKSGARFLSESLSVAIAIK